MMNKRPSRPGKPRLALLSLGLFLLIPSSSLLQAQSQEKKIALTFEKLPFMNPLGYWRPREVSTMLLKPLDEQDIKVAGFVVEEKVEEDPSTYILLNDWVEQGHVLGNQTWGDADFNVLSDEHFLEHVRDGQKTLRDLARQHDFPYRFLRFPQLHEGNEPGKKRRLRRVLKRNDYRVAPVSINTADYVFNPIYVEHEQEPEAIDRLRQLYLAHMAEAVDYAERQSQAVFGRNITHIMRLHIGIATARFLPDLIEQLKADGYTFVSFLVALEDEAYATEEDYVGPLGLSFTDRVAATRGLPFDEDSGGGLTRAQVVRQLEAQ